MQINEQDRYDRFMDTVKLNLIVWKRNARHDYSEIAQKLETSDRTARRRFKYTDTMTLGELFAICELYGKDPVELLKQASAAAAHDFDSNE
jgi:hypothetical protein